MMEKIMTRLADCVGCIYFRPNVIEEHCTHDPETWNADTCYTEDEGC